VRPADSGRVLLDGADLYQNLDAFRTVLGYVPQDDIIHTELPVEATLRYAAQLRLARDTPADELDRTVESTMSTLDLIAKRDVRVGSLSGGQRKRASIAVELLTDPQLFFLDEPTSGLDPATAAELTRAMRRLSDSSATVIFTTHAVQDLVECDRVVFMARGGRVAFTGTVEAALQHFGADRIEGIYQRLAGGISDDALALDDPDPPAGIADDTDVLRITTFPARTRPGSFRQFVTLTRRTLDTIRHNKLTLAILVGSPMLVVAMMAVLFRPGAFDFDDPSPTSIVMILFWVTFGSFFFGLTYGLLQVCTEQAILRREHLVGLRLTPYLLSKVAVLLPFLVLVNVAMLGVLRVLDRLPAADIGDYLSMGFTLTLAAAGALMLGLLTSAAVGHPSQATLALPMLCFPAVLFSGAILPVHQMADAGAVISTVMLTRLAFEALGHDLGVRTLLEDGGSPLGPPLLESYGDAGTSDTVVYWLILAGFTLVLFVGALLVLRKRCTNAAR